ncbi:DUF397 domain-containing protein [Streptomyces sp. NPDC017991]|uniref:DUF397 domain-containing protein n=1 Tax=Streptomyces sp. NPDC017991 TaxID=3365026 RepID=UPI003793FB9A
MTTDLHWFKSSYSGNDGECVEVAMQWTKSSYSGSQGGECLEIAIPHATSAGTTLTTIHVRDSKALRSRTLRVAPATWAAFLPYAVAVGSGQPNPH